MSVEIDLESGQPVAVAEPETPAEPAIEPAAAEPEPEPAAAAEPAEPAAPRGAVKELLENRRALKESQQRLAQYENDPALRLLTPELRQALAEGRIITKPQTTTADAERERLTELAHDGGFVTADGKPDLDAAARADKLIQKVAARVAAPAMQRVQQLEASSHTSTANGNIAAVWTQAQKDGIPAEAMAVVTQEFQVAMSQPNAAQSLAQPEIVNAIFERAIGRAFREGKLSGKAAPVKPAGAQPIVAEPGGRRAPAASALQLTPQIAAVYANAGLDPSKTPSAKALKVVAGGVELES